MDEARRRRLELLPPFCQQVPPPAPTWTPPPRIPRYRRACASTSPAPYDRPVACGCYLVGHVRAAEKQLQATTRSRTKKSGRVFGFAGMCHSATNRQVIDWETHCCGVPGAAVSPLRPPKMGTQTITTFPHHPVALSLSLCLSRPSLPFYIPPYIAPSYMMASNVRCGAAALGRLRGQAHSTHHHLVNTYTTAACAGNLANGRAAARPTTAEPLLRVADAARRPQRRHLADFVRGTTPDGSESAHTPR